MPRPFRPARRALPALALVPALLLLNAPREGHAALIRPDARQAFPDLSADIVGTQRYTFDPAAQVGTFVVRNTPTLLALGPDAARQVYVTDTAGTIRSQVLSIKLDADGNLQSDPSNAFALNGTVTVDGRTFSGNLLEGTPTRFGWAAQNPATPSMSVFDVELTLTGGQLKELYGPDAYLRIITETASTFDGTFARDFSGDKALTNLRAYNATSPNPIPEPSTFAILVAVGGVGLAYNRRRRIAPRELIRP